LGYSRSDESEADKFAVRYLKDTNYKPDAFADFFQRLEAKDGNMGMFQFLSTHPDPGNRVEKIKEEAKLN
jgi:predicted Zn-dependent protease